MDHLYFVVCKVPTQAQSAHLTNVYMCEKDCLRFPHPHILIDQQHPFVVNIDNTIREGYIALSAAQRQQHNIALGNFVSVSAGQQNTTTTCVEKE